MKRLVIAAALAVLFSTIANARTEIVKHYWVITAEDPMEIQNYATAFNAIINTSTPQRKSLKGTTCPLGILMDSNGEAQKVMALARTKTETCSAALSAVSDKTLPLAPKAIRGAFVMFDYIP